MTTYAPEVHAHRPHVNVWLVAVVVLAAALIGLGTWVVVDSYAGGDSATDEATQLLDDMYAASTAYDEQALRSLLADDVVVWINGDTLTGADEMIDGIMTTPGLTVTRIAPVTVEGDFATTYIQFTATGIVDGPMLETVRIEDGKIVRMWDFLLGVTPPFTNTTAPVS